MIDPGIPEVLVMPSSQSTSSESTSPVPQPPISTSEITSQSNDPAAPKMLPASIAKTCYSSQPQLLLMSRIEEIFDYQPVSAHGGKVPCATCARRSAPLVGALRNANRRESIPVITDHRLPIVIDDTDEETKDEDVLETRAAATAQCGNPKDGKPNESHERSLRKRVTAQHVKDRWDQPEYEEKLLRELRLAFYHHESCWMHIRELPEATSDAKVQLHDTNVQKFAQICRVNEAVSVEETQTLRKSCIDVIDHLLTVLSCGEDKDAVEELRRFVDEMQDHAMILSSIYAYRSDDDTQDEDYQPSKKRRL
ncbi:hypothetical protein EJ07DRAFT_152608 [Lizonia empirigonia]|nr:hypothetical protein EJ07DRAFT_152608 [Lizonia empirigonia]